MYLCNCKVLEHKTFKLKAKSEEIRNKWVTMIKEAMEDVSLEELRLQLDNKIVATVIPRL